MNGIAEFWGAEVAERGIEKITDVELAYITTERKFLHGLRERVDIL